jgi:2-dehydropantoate 2-reductase
MASGRQSVAVVGAGAIGGLIAAELHAAGHQVTLCARRSLTRLLVEREGAVRDLAVVSVGDAGDGALAVATSPADVSPVPWVIVALKGQDSPAAGAWLSQLVDGDTVVIAVQNGIEHRERIGPQAHGAVVLPALANTAVERIAPGHLVHRAGDLLTVPDDSASESFSRLLGASALRVKIEPDFVSAAWRKLLSNLAANPLTTLTNRRMEVFADPMIRELALGLLREAVVIGRAEGALLGDDEPERTLAAYAQVPTDSGTSMLYDRTAGRPLEYDALTGAVVRAALRHGLQAPLNQALLALLAGLDATATRRSSGSS